MRDAAKRSNISLSKAYAIVNGDDNVEFETFENIATAFGLTPAELAIAIGKGSAEHDPAEARVVALYRQVPADKRPAAEDMLHGLAVQPTRPPANRRRDGLANRLKQRVHDLTTGTEHGDDPGNNPRITDTYDRTIWPSLLGFERHLAPSGA